MVPVFLPQILGVVYQPPCVHVMPQWPDQLVTLWDLELLASYLFCNAQP